MFSPLLIDPVLRNRETQDETVRQVCILKLESSYLSCTVVVYRILKKNKHTYFCIFQMQLTGRRSHLVESGRSCCCRSAALPHCPIPVDRAHSQIQSADLRTGGEEKESLSVRKDNNNGLDLYYAPRHSKHFTLNPLFNLTTFTLLVVSYMWNQSAPNGPFDHHRSFTDICRRQRGTQRQTMGFELPTFWPLDSLVYVFIQSVNTPMLLVNQQGQKMV